MIGIDLFAGAGGMSLGAQLSGINVVTCVDNDKHAILTYSHNFKSGKNVCKDIRDVTCDDLEIPRRNEPLIVFGGPPCQGFSTSNQKTRNAQNPHNWLFLEYIRIIREVRPDWLVFENVKGILETEKGLFLREVLKALSDIGYHLSWKILNAVNYGVPQNRSRIFVVGCLENKNFVFPSESSAKPIVVDDALSDLPELENGSNFDTLPYKSKPNSKYAEEMRGEKVNTANHLVTKNADHITARYKHIPQGGNWLNIPDEQMQNYKDHTRCHTGIYYRLKSTSPSVVIGNYRKNMLIHPFQDRGLSVREAARLQSFPDWFEFKGSIGFQQQQVGNSVPSLLAKAVFGKIIEIAL